MSETPESLEAFLQRALAPPLEAFGLGGSITLAPRRGPGRATLVATVHPPSGSALPLRRWRQVATALQALVDAALSLRGEADGVVEVVLSEPATAYAAGEVDEPGLVTAARELARRAASLGRPFALGPMSAVERRLVHQALGEVPEVWTKSEGDGMFRRLWVVPRELVRTPAADES